MTLVQRLHIQPEAFSAILARVAQGATMLLALPCVVLRMSVYEQGLFFSFLSLATLFQAFDLGLPVIIVQTASMLRARQRDNDLARFWRAAQRVILVSLTAEVVMVSVIGIVLFRSTNHDPEQSLHWMAPWIAFAILSSCAQGVLTATALIEGSLSPAVSWRFQRNMEAVSGTVLVFALVMGAGLWSLPSFAATRFGATVAWLVHRRHDFPPSARPFGFEWWRRHIWPFQWRIALNSLSFFLLFRVFNPIVLAELGPKSASQFGLSWSIMTTLMATLIVWPASQIAPYTGLMASGHFIGLRKRFHKMLAVSTGFAILAAMAIISILWLANQITPEVSQHFAGLDTVALLLAAAVTHHFVACFAPLLRSEGRDPMAGMNVLSALVTFAACWLVAKNGNLHDISAAYLACTAASVPYCLWLYRSFSGRWSKNEQLSD